MPPGKPPYLLDITRVMVGFELGEFPVQKCVKTSDTFSMSNGSRTTPFSGMSFIPL